MTDDQTTLLAAIEAAPDDRTAKLIYADWLEENGFPEEAAFNRLLGGGATDLPLTRRQFESAIVGQRDDEDYQESGYVACVFRHGGVEFATLAMYGHCSCYGTWTDICGGGVSDYYDQDEVKVPKWTWVGPVAELVRMAVEESDPVLPGRKVSDQDSNAHHLRDVYAQVRAWAAKNGRLCA